ncbi:MAG: bifunctional glutamate N-acetyltransferase/amino-acid acetyltransferase ArgJ [Candidatus Omnitrophica bacterium]|nr:bifunctional glutamate N-acetyltransferase/amino-acid acetyltransferase ArgJ [Candidatus Omnitrophota bacterium]
MKLPLGFSLAGTHCGLKKNGFDLGLIYCDTLATGAGFFTINKNKAYSVIVSQKNIQYPVKAVLANSGNANCFSHKKGLSDTRKICARAAHLLDVKEKNILIASTGIIGKKMPKEKIIAALPSLIKARGQGVNDFTSSILTTDTFRKISCAKVSLGKKNVTIIGFAKGAGMIAPTMATMLAFVLTDADIPKALLKKIGKSAVEESFNSITVDGCMSTNDTLFILASKKVPVTGKKEIEAFSAGLKKVCLELAKMVAADGEGATKFITIKIRGARSTQEAKKAGLALANSNLLKCAIYGANPNWGRIVQALGAVGIAVDESTPIILSPLSKKEVTVTVDLKQGNAAWNVYTSDLTPEYVKINAEYS